MKLVPWFGLLTTLPLGLLALTLIGCAGEEATEEEPPLSLDVVAEAYVKLVLAVGEHDDGYVDAYYGPEAWREEARATPRSLTEIGQEAAEWIARLDAAAAALPASPPEGEMVTLRRRYLERQLESLAARVEMLSGQTRSFDDESRALYDAVAPTLSEELFERVLAELDARLATEGYDEGTLIERYDAFRKDFVVPPERLDAVFRAAIDACRERTAAHLDLPPGESFRVEYVTDKPWSGYNWYQGDYHSLIQVNTDLPFYIDRALDLACHEGYPGHHVYNALLEMHLVKGRGWIEYSIYPLYSPQSLIAEGSANYGVEMAFPGKEKIEFAREVLFPLAGLDASRAAIYEEVQQLLERLSYAGNEAARRYLDGELSADEAAEWLTHYAATSRVRAEQRVRFYDKYRSYVINYNLGEDLVERYIERVAGDDLAARWQVFGELLSSPRLPSSLK